MGWPRFAVSLFVAAAAVFGPVLSEVGLSRAQSSAPTSGVEQAAMNLVDRFSTECGYELLVAKPVIADRESSDLWQSCMRANYPNRVEEPPLQPTTTFRIKNRTSGLYLTKSWVGDKYEQRYTAASRASTGTDGYDLWVLVPHSDRYVPGDTSRRPYWGSDKSSPNLFRIVNVKTGLELWTAFTPQWGYSPPSDIDQAALAPRFDNTKLESVLWDFQFLSGPPIARGGTGLASGRTAMIFNWMTKKALRTQGVGNEARGVTVRSDLTPQSPEAVWVLEEGPKLYLSRIYVNSTKAVRTSTGQDKNTQAMFTAIETVIEYGPGLATGGGTLAQAAANAAKHAAAAIAKAAAKKAAQKAAQAIAKKAAENAAKRVAARSAAALAQYEAQLAAKKAAQQVSKTLAEIVAKQTAKKTTAKLFVKTAYGKLAKLAGVKGGTRAITRKLVEMGQQAAIDKAMNIQFQIAMDLAEDVSDVAALDPLDETDLLDPGEIPDFSKIMEEIDNAPGRQKDEGWLQMLFSPLIDDTADDLEIRLNGQSVWPNGGLDHRSISTGSTLPVGVSIIFDRAVGMNITFIEYDYGSSDDNLGSIALDTANLSEKEEYEAAYLYSTSEGSLYEVNFTLQPYTVPTDAEIVQARQQDEYAEALRMATDAEIYSRIKRETDVDFPARKKTQDERIEAETRAEILRTGGPDALQRYDNLNIWREAYRKECVAKLTVDNVGVKSGNWYDRYRFDLLGKLGGLQLRNGRDTIPGTWIMGPMNARGEKDRSNPQTLVFGHDNWFDTFGPLDNGGTAGEWSGRPLVRFDSDTMADLTPIDPVAGGPLPYCDGFFVINNAKGIAFDSSSPGAPVTVKPAVTHGPYAGPLDQHQNYLPLFTIGKDKPEAYFLNAIGEPVMWLEKAADADPLPVGLCHIYGEPKTWRDDHDLAKVMPGTWEAKRVPCFTGEDLRADWAGDVQRWVFTADGILVGAGGPGPTNPTFATPWEDLRNGYCRIKAGVGQKEWNGKEKPPYEFKLERNNFGMSEWNFAAKITAPAANGRDANTCYQVRQIGPTVRYGEMSLADRTWLDEYRAARSMPRPESEQADVEALAKVRATYVAGLTPNQLANRCDALGVNFTKPTRYSPDADVKITNDSLVPWSVYWVDTKGNDRVDFKSKKPIAPPAVLQPGETKIISGNRGNLYAIFGSGPEYGASGCVGTVTAASGAAFTSNGEEAQRLKAVAEAERLAKQAAQQKAYLEMLDRWAAQSAAVKRLAEAEEVRRLAVEAKRQADEDAERARQQAIQDSRGCLDPHPFYRQDYMAPVTGRIANTGPEDLYVYWGTGKAAGERPKLIIAPGETKEISDYFGERYRIADRNGKCLAVFEPDSLSAARDFVVGDGSVPANGPVIRQVEVAADRTQDLSQRQIANGCAAYGHVASKPDLPSRRQLSIRNQGKLPLTLYWVSFYGANEDRVEYRNPQPLTVLEPGGFYFAHDRIPLYRGDVFAVLDPAGNCVGMIQPGDTIEVKGADGSVKQVQRDGYAFADQQSAADIEAKFAASEAKKHAMAELMASLEARFAKGQCPSDLTLLDRVNGGWEVGTYDTNARSQMLGPTMTFWTIQHGSIAGGRPEDFSAQVSNVNGCQWSLRGRLPGGYWAHINFIFNDDGSTEFYVPGKMKLTEGGDEVPAPMFWGRLLPGAGLLTDLDELADAVDENVPAGTTVGVRAFANFGDNAVAYSVSGNPAFAVDPQTGILSVAGPLDRETSVSQTVTILARSADGAEAKRDFDIAIADVNETPVSEIVDTDPEPDFVRENSAIGTRIGITAAASDSDATDTIAYSLDQDGGGGFAIDAKTGLVSVAGPVDFEFAAVQRIDIVASSSDGGQSRAGFDIAIGDVNEFGITDLEDHDDAPNSVAETAGIGTPVGLTLRASDFDGSAAVRYERVGRDFRLFGVHPDTGIVTLEGVPTQPGDYEIEVAASSSDGGTSRARFIIRVTDVNLHAMSAITDGDRRPNVVSEAAPVGTPVGIVALATDDDANTQVRLALSDSAGGRFAIDPVNGVVLVAGHLDFETAAGHSIEVEAASSDGSSGRGRFDIAITDANEAGIGPVTDSDPGANAVAEDAVPGTPVGIVAFASDGDASDTIGYQLTDDARRGFAIDPFSGLVTVIGRLDHETASQQSIEVEALSSDRTASRARFDIAVADANEFGVEGLTDADPSENSVEENAPFGTYTGITAIAADPDASDSVSYWLLDDGGGLFAIDPISGVVTVAGNIDFEDRWSQSVLVAADSTDGSSRELWFEVRFRDVNEFEISPLVDTDPAPDQIGENAAYGDPVGISVQASDADGGGQRIHYALADDQGNEVFDQGAFAINSATGTISVSDNRQLRGLGEGEIRINVLAQSNDGSSRVESFPIWFTPELKWWQNPEGPRREEDYSLVAPTDRDICVAADEDISRPDTYNNENAYFDCMDGFQPPVVTWYDDPRDPRGVDTSVYADVSEDDWNACVAANEDPSSVFFNNEALFYDCVDRAKPENTNWYSNPRDPRGVDTSIYSGISDVDWGRCVTANENPASPVYNNEKAFYDCADSFLNALPPNDEMPTDDDMPTENPPMDDGGQGDSLSQGEVNACAAQTGSYFEASDGGSALISIVNNGANGIDIYPVTDPAANDGGATPDAVASVESGTSQDFEGQRQASYAAMDWNGLCVGGLKARESRNSFTFP